MLFWNAGIMGRKEQLLEAIFGSMRSSKEVTATSRRHHVATSPSHDVGSTNAEVNNSATSRRRDVATSPRCDVSSKNLHLIIKCQRARKLGHRKSVRRETRNLRAEQHSLQGTSWNFVSLFNCFGYFWIT